MNEFEILAIMKKKMGERFLGVFASDELPLRVPYYPCSVIVNLDPRTKEGSHWVAIHLDGKASASYMDSFGLPPLVKSVHDFIRRNATKLFINQKMIQHPSSTSCGQYCIMYVLHRHKGGSNKSFFSKLKNPMLNEKSIQRRFRSVLRHART